MITLPSSFTALAALNLLWFSAGFYFFWLRSASSAKMLVPKASRASPLFATVAASIRFLGGLNLAFALFCFLLICNQRLFPVSHQLAVFSAVFVVAHGSQFVINLSIAQRGRKACGPLWPVLRGPMRIIFLGDFTFAIANVVQCLCLMLAG